MPLFEFIWNKIKDLISGPMTKEEVERALEERAKAPEFKNLDWRHSIVDLLKLLEIDSSLRNRQDLAAELGSAALVDGTAASNMQLQKDVMEAIAKRYVIIPEAPKAWPEPSMTSQPVAKASEEAPARKTSMSKEASTKK